MKRRVLERKLRIAGCYLKREAPVLYLRNVFEPSNHFNGSMYCLLDIMKSNGIG